MKKNTKLPIRAITIFIITLVSRLVLDWPVIALIVLALNIIWEVVLVRPRWKLFNSLRVLSLLIPAYLLLAFWEYLTLYL